MAWKALVAPNLGTVDGPGWCLRFSQSVFGAPARYESAWQAWENQKIRHAPSEKLPNVPVLLWFSHYGTYGTPARYGNWGHVAVWIPGRGILSSPVTNGWDGRGNPIRTQQWFPDIPSLERAMPCTYAGWTEDINDLRVARNEPDPKEDEDMARILNAKTTTDHTKPSATENKVYWDGGPGVGIIHVKNPSHLNLLNRYLADKPGEKFYPAELKIINSYVAPER